MTATAGAPKYGTVRKLAGNLCTDPIKIVNGKASRFIDNHWYVGHDEPSVKFISSRPGSGNTMTYLMKLSKDPKKLPTPSGSVTDYGQLSVAPWFGLPICDPKSYPQNPCTPDSDTNTRMGSPTDAGSAFMELQFYPPGFTPFIDSTSCSATKWCAALTIDSLEANFNFANLNPDCTEPVNFAYLQTNGVPAGPPSPQLTDASTFTPNGHTLMINPGDEVAVSISDPPQGFTTVVRDLTTHQTGFMTASASNGFMNTDISSCSGTPFTFHAEYSTASIQNQVPWAALEGGVLMEQEIGHGEACNSLASRDPFTASYRGRLRPTATRSVFDTCVRRPRKVPAATGEGSVRRAPAARTPPRRDPRGPRARPDHRSRPAARCASSPTATASRRARGPRSASIGVATTESSAVPTTATPIRFQNGDLDFDGTGLTSRRTWPERHARTTRPPAQLRRAPTPAAVIPYPHGPVRVRHRRLLQPLRRRHRRRTAPSPPISADFYPFWSRSSSAGQSWSGQ